MSFIELLNFTEANHYINIIQYNNNTMFRHKHIDLFPEKKLNGATKFDNITSKFITLLTYENRKCNLMIIGKNTDPLNFTKYL